MPGRRPVRPVLDLAMRGAVAARCARCSTGSSASAVDGRARCKLGSGRTITVRDARPAGAARAGSVRRRAAAARGGGAPRHAVGATRARRRSASRPAACPARRRTRGLASRVGGADVSTARRLPAGPGEQVAAEDGGHRLSSATVTGDRLCVGRRRAACRTASDCVLPPVDAASRARVRPRRHGVAVLPADVARVRLPERPRGPVVAGRRLHRPLRRPGALPAHRAAARAPTGRCGTSSASGELPRARASSSRGPAEAGPVTRARCPGRRLGRRPLRHRGASALGASLGRLPVRLLRRRVRSSIRRHVVSCRPRRAVLYGTLARRPRAPCGSVLRGGRRLRAAGDPGAAGRSAAAARTCSPSRAARASSAC